MRSPKEVIETYLSRAREWATLPDDLTVHVRRLGLAAMAVLAVNQYDPLPNTQNGTPNIEVSDALTAQKDGVTIEVEELVKMPISQNLDGEKTLYGYLKKNLKDVDVYTKLSAENQADFLDALIALLRNLNVDKNLDNPNGLKGADLYFPKVLTLKLEAPEGPLTKDYSYLQDAALLDGFDVRDTTQTDTIYANALASGIELEENAESFYRKNGVTTPNKLADDVKERFTQIADRFYETTGYKIAYTDILRNRAMILATRGSIPESTHPTGRSIDVADGRFKNKEGKEITWSVKNTEGNYERGPDADKIEDLRNKLVGILKDDNVFIFKEAGHWHLYFGKTEPYVLTLEKAFGLENTPTISLEDLNIQTDIPNPQSQGESIPTSNLLKELINTRPSETLNVEQGETAWNKIYLRWNPSQTPKRPQLTLLTTGAKNHDLQLEAVTWLQNLSESSFFQLAPLKGLTIHKDSTKIPHYGDTKNIWSYKVKHKLNSPKTWEDAIKKLSEENNVKPSFKEYITSIEESNKLLSENAAIFKLPAWAKYLTPEVNLAIMQAEFFSEFRGNTENTKTFLKLLPTLFRHYDILRGPAINDKRLSGGAIQVIDTTYDLVVKQHRRALAAVMHPTPSKTDKEAYLKAMIFDIKSQALTNQLIIIDHLSLGMSYLLKDPHFKEAWDNAGDQEKTRFLGTLAPLAINGGKGIPPKAGKIALNKINTKNLEDYTKAIGDIGEDDAGDGIGSFAARGANVGYLTMQVVLPPN